MYLIRPCLQTVKTSWGGSNEKQPLWGTHRIAIHADRPKTRWINSK